MVLLGWSRAILLQLAHPLVAAGVADHSSFRAGGASSVVRLHHTTRAMLALTFGDQAGRDAALNGIRAIHRRVHGTLRTHTGIFPAGTPYSAEDPDLVLWVHATLLESIPMIYERVISPMTMAERDAYCNEASQTAIDLGARPREVPRTWQATLEYIRHMYATGVIAVGNDARELAAAVLAPPYAWLVAPLASVNRVLTVGLLPQAIREQYGFAWSSRDDHLLTRNVRIIRNARKVLPNRLALWSEAIYPGARGSSKSE
jgi:uncharacterized protein (DUF2236 family)